MSCPDWMTRLTVLCVCGFLLVTGAGCAGLQTLGWKQYHQLTNVTYPNHSPEEVKQAARQVFVLADDRMKITPTQKRLRVLRWWKKIKAPVALYGIDQWYLNFHVQNGGTKVHLKVSTILYTTGVGAGSPYNRTVSPNGPAVYELFWNRVGYFLGKTNSWSSCHDIQQQIERDETFGDIFQLCGHGADDHRPSG